MMWVEGSMMELMKAEDISIAFLLPPSQDRSFDHPGLLIHEGHFWMLCVSSMWQKTQINSFPLVPHLELALPCPMEMSLRYLAKSLRRWVSSESDSSRQCFRISISSSLMDYAFLESHSHDTILLQLQLLRKL